MSKSNDAFMRERESITIDDNLVVDFGYEEHLRESMNQSIINNKKVKENGSN